jgi:glycerate-2-kinase
LVHDIIRNAIAAVHPVEVAQRKISRHGNQLTINNQTIDLDLYKQIHIISAGKGAVPFYEGLSPAIEDRLTGGVIVAPPGQISWDDRLTVIHGSHPIPDQHSLQAGKTVSRYIDDAIGPDDLVFVLITGGASSLMELPAPGVAIEDIAHINRLLLAGGASITEINTVRKQLSALKGGKLAGLIAPATIITLIISDIVDSPLQDIGSGPTIPNPTTRKDAASILHQYNIHHQLPQHIRDFFAQDGPQPPAPQNHRHVLLADNHTLLNAAQEAAIRLNIPAIITSATEQEDAARHAKATAQTMRAIIEGNHPLKPPILLISGGELTVTLKDNPGKGGRNQEFILALLDRLSSLPTPFPFFATSIGTDGIDGPTDTAGAWIDEQTPTRAKANNLTPATFLQQNDSYNFFAPLGQLIFTGPTGANCMDLRLIYLPDS